MLAKLHEVFGPPPYTTGAPQKPKDYSPDVTGRITERLVRARARSRSKPFFIWWAPAAPHREDVATTLMGRPGRRPAPGAALRAAEQAATSCPSPPSFNEPDITDKPSNMQSTTRPTMSDAQIDQLQLDYQGRAGSLLRGRRPRREAGRDPAQTRTSSRTR